MIDVDEPNPYSLNGLRITLALCTSILCMVGWPALVFLWEACLRAENLTEGVKDAAIFALVLSGYVLVVGYWYLPHRASPLSRAVFWCCSAGYNSLLVLLSIRETFTSMGMWTLSISRETLLIEIVLVGYWSAVICLSLALARRDLTKHHQQMADRERCAALAGTKI